MADDNEHGKFASRIRSTLDATKEKAKKLSDEADWVFGRRTWRVLGVVALFAVVVALLWVFLNWYVAPTKPSDNKDLVLALAQILAGTALLSGLYFTWRTLQVNREGQITERFTRAIDQLGSEKLEIKLGGIYSLERIARESEEDHWSIVEVLTAYVRQHAPWRPEEAQQGEEDAAVKNSGEGSREATETTEGPPPSPDIQAIMTVLRRRTRFFGHGEPEPLDLHRTNLRQANLRQANLRQANLTEANLPGANLEGAYLRGAYLTEANLTEAVLERADLWAAFLMGADFTGAFLTKANLQWGSLHRAVLSEANLREADLRKRNLTEANLRQANLTEANLTEADLPGADLRGADLSRARGLIQTRLEKAIGDETTALPPHLKPPAHWGVKPDEQPEADEQPEED